METPRVRLRTAVALGACLVTAYGYFYQGGGWNQNSRYALVRAVIEHGTLRIDETGRFEGRPVTGDLARHDGHLYSDKAPGLALVAIPPVALLYPFVTDPTSRSGIADLSYVATVLTAGIPTVVAALLVFQLAGRFGYSRGAGVLAALVFGVGSPAWCYATLFYGHALSTCCLMAAFTAAVALRGSSTARRDRVLGSIVGAGGGWATVTEYPAAIPAAMIALLALISVGSSDARRLRHAVADITVAALVCAAVLVVYNVVSFGGPLSLGYSFGYGSDGLARGFFGHTYPNRDVLVEILFGQGRGLFPLAPVLAAAPVGFALLIRRPVSRASGLTALAIVIYYVLLNASFQFWHGGWSFGPRYIAPALPFMSVALAPLWSSARPALRVVLCALALYGGAVSLVGVSTTAQPPDNIARPMTELLWPSFTAGRLSLNWQSFVEDDLRGERDPETHAWNAGEKLGLKGLASLLPLFAIWCAIGLVYWWASRRVSPDHTWFSRAVQGSRR